jgi:hypothetical protein
MKLYKKVTELMAPVDMEGKVTSACFFTRDEYVEATMNDIAAAAAKAGPVFVAKQTEHKDEPTGHMFPADATPIQFVYTNYKGVKSTRHVLPVEVKFGHYAWHCGKVPQRSWFLVAWDLDKKLTRHFLLGGIKNICVANVAESRKVHQANAACVGAVLHVSDDVKKRIDAYVDSGRLSVKESSAAQSPSKESAAANAERAYGLYELRRKLHAALFEEHEDMLYNREFDAYAVQGIRDLKREVLIQTRAGERMDALLNERNLLLEVAGKRIKELEKELELTKKDIEAHYERQKAMDAAKPQEVELTSRFDELRLKLWAALNIVDCFNDEILVEEVKHLKTQVALKEASNRNYEESLKQTDKKLEEVKKALKEKELLLEVAGTNVRDMQREVSSLEVARDDLHKELADIRDFLGIGSACEPGRTLKCVKEFHTRKESEIEELMRASKALAKEYADTQFKLSALRDAVRGIIVG